MKVRDIYEGDIYIYVYIYIYMYHLHIYLSPSYIFIYSCVYIYIYREREVGVAGNNHLKENFSPGKYCHEKHLPREKLKVYQVKILKKYKCRYLYY